MYKKFNLTFYTSSFYSKTTIMKIKILVLLLTLTTGLVAQQTKIKDPNFELALIKIGLDDIIDGQVTTSNISSVKSLDVSSQNIFFMEGIEDFASLEYLNCSYNHIKNIELDKNEALKRIDCANNVLESINSIGGNNSIIEIVKIQNNELDYFSTFDYPNLKELICYNNELQGLWLSSNDKLEKLICNNNLLTSIEIRNNQNSKIISFNSTNNPDLTCIFVNDKDFAEDNWQKDANSHFVANDNACDDFRYITIPDSKFEQKLVSLFIDREPNDGRVLESSISRINELDISNSGITDLSGIEHFKSLTTLDCSQNELSELNIQDLKKLETLKCNFNKITNLDLSKNTLLNKVDCSNNLITNLNIDNLLSLQELICFQNKIGNLDFSTNFNLKIVNLNNNRLASIDFTHQRKLNSLNCDYNNLKGIEVNTNAKIHDVNLGNNKFTSIDLSNFSNTEILHIDSNSIENIDLSTLSNLKELYINQNKLTTLDLSTNNKIETVRCEYNQITSLDFTNNIFATGIDCSNNKLTNLDLRIKPNNIKVNATSNPSLSCIYVLNPAYSYSKWNIDDTSHFVKNQSDCSNNANEITEVEPNNSKETATEIELGSKVSGILTKEEYLDFFKITIPENGYISIVPSDTTKFKEDLFMFIEGTRIVYAKDFNPISKGTYFIQISHYKAPTGDLPYSFTSSFTPDTREVDEVENDFFKNAPELSFTNGNEGILGYKNNGEPDYDIYKFVAPRNGRILLSDLFEEKLDYAVSIYDEDSTLLAEKELDHNKLTARTAVLPKNFLSYMPFAGYYQILEEGNTYYVKLSDIKNIYNPSAGKYNLKVKYVDEPKGDFEYMIEDEFLFLNNKTDIKDLVDIEWLFYKEDQHLYDSDEENPKIHLEEPGRYKVVQLVVSLGGQDRTEKEIIYGDFYDIVPKTIGSNGKNTIKIYNPTVNENSEISISKNGKTVDAVRVTKISKGITEAVFFLDNEEIGEWSINVKNMGSDSIVLDEKLTLEERTGNESGTFSLWPIQNKRYLPNRWQDFTVRYKNTGYTDLVNPQIWISISDPEKLELELKGGRKIEYPEYVYTHNLVEKFDSITPYIDVDDFLGEGVSARIYPLYIPLVKAGESGTLSFKIKSSATDRLIINVWTYDNETNTQGVTNLACYGKTLGTPCVQQLLEKIGTDIADKAVPGVACAMSVGGEVDNLVGDESRDVGSVVYSWASIAVNCGSLAFPPARAVFTISWAIVSNIIDYATIGSNCYDKKHRKSNKGVGIGSSDPNSIIGPIGSGIEKYMQPDEMAFYTVNFENKSIATASAQEIWIYDTLDVSKFDMSKFSFGSIAIGDSIYKISSNKKSFIKDIDFRPKQNLIGRVIGKATDEGIIEVYFRSLNPSTLEDNTDPDLGILPPNNISPEGEGSVSYYVGLKNPVNGKTYENKATIVFDFNDAIETNTWINTIDEELPTSNIISYNFDTEKVEVTLNMQGNDALSGINDYIIFSSLDGGNYSAIGRTSTGQLVYKLPENGEYKFYSIATDKAFNKESIKQNSEASFVVDQLSIDDFEFNSLFSIYPNPATSSFKIESKYKVLELSIYNASGVRVKFYNSSYKAFSVDGLTKGVYLVSMKTKNGIANKKLIIN